MKRRRYFSRTRAIRKMMVKSEEAPKRGLCIVRSWGPVGPSRGEWLTYIVLRVSTQPTGMVDLFGTIRRSERRRRRSLRTVSMLACWVLAMGGRIARGLKPWRVRTCGTACFGSGGSFKRPRNRTSTGEVCVCITKQVLVQLCSCRSAITRLITKGLSLHAPSSRRD